MSNAFAARFSISYVEDLGSNIWQITGDVCDDSLFGYTAPDVQVGDIIIDENGMTGVSNRWKISTIISASGKLLVCNVVWDDSGTVDSNGPAACEGAIARPTLRGKIAEIPVQALAKVSENVQIQLENINQRTRIDEFSKIYEHTQSSAASSWDIEHNLGRRNCNINVYDTNHNIIWPGNIEAVDDNSITVTFPVNVAGYATITG